MFTGLVQQVGVIVALELTPTGRRLTLQSTFEDIVIGESIAIDGVCLTAIEPAAGRFVVEVSPETLAVTTFGQCAVGAQVNLERSLRVGDRLGGHFVTGHVDTQATVGQIEHQAAFWLVRFVCPAEARLDYLVAKGSIALNGVSLTLNTVTAEGFTVMLIPHTLEQTNLAKLVVGARVNLEYDMLAKLVVNATQRGVSV